ncbi:hypothetical protein [Xanthomonas theicola]|uniref:ParB/Sulfiredoxin domain-containing protein n=1 Tax=Xanthomonas theicola TaxID=56464 RepID=A0A2S6ZBP1_9XANT|nr:hypothetical protein [Xanthomonas theicola]PPT84627.1 hypothetical protein XthCFBP4691_16455 [Xanthomonas theicola]QNH24649.1 hypothetical protein G4Q83_07665 [Xanthomonas theicola]
MSANISNDGIDPTAILRGLLPLPRLIRFVRERCPPRSLDEAMLMHEWREARAVALRLIDEEAGHADDVGVQALPEDMKALADHVLRQPSMHRLTSLVPRSWCMVEIDRLIVFQESINLRHADQLKASLPPAPSAQDVMDLAACNGAHSHPEVRFTQSDGEYTFASESNDLRFLDVTTVEPTAIANYEPFGSASHAIVIYLGFSDNVISATRFGKRIILTNGSHRAYALRELGLRYVPCLLTDASNEDTSDFLLPAAVKQDRQFYLRAPRPPLFKDYTDSRLTRIVPVVRKHYALRAKLDLQRITVPAL